MDFLIIFLGLKLNKRMMKYWKFIRNLFKWIFVNGNWIKLVYVNWNEFIVKDGIKFRYEI